MIDDVTDSSASGPIDVDEVKDLWRFQVQRAQSEQWALRDIRFLVYDDTCLTDHGYDSDDEEAMMQRGLQMSLENEEEPESDGINFTRPVREIKKQRILEEHAISDTPANVKSAEAYDGDEDEDLQRAIALSLGQKVDDSGSIRDKGQTTAGSPPCKICATLPEFPHAFKARKFRLFRPTEEQFRAARPCMHYVAVSYCWPEPVLDEEGNIVKSEGSYHIRELDGRVRKSRALNDIIDRAVDFANTCGLRMIWIDQECLPQPTQDSPKEDKDYQQAGVQSMDILYNRAVVTAGLHAGAFASQAQLDAVQELIALNEGKAKRRWNYDVEFINHVARFLDMVCHDRWYTRAWVVQESLSAGSGLFLVFRRGSADAPGGRIRFSDRYDVPKHSLDSMVRQTPSSQVHIHVDSFRGLVCTAKSLFEPYFQRVGSKVVHHDSFDAQSILDAAASLHPTVAKSNQMVNMHGRNIYGNRQKLDGASALTLLKTRKCRYPEDRIAILANMCCYEVRLNTDEMAKHCKSLRVGLLAVMLLNGDVSALAPEVYYPSLESEMPSHLGLTSPFDCAVGGASYCSISQGNLLVPHVYTHSNNPGTGPHGLPLHGYLWAVEGELDLTPIKLQWAEDWNELKCIGLGIERLKGEIDEAFEQRKQITAQHFARDDITKLVKAEISRHGGPIPHDSPFWASLPPGATKDGLHITTHLNAHFIKAHPVARHNVAQIIFRTLEYLFSLSASDSRAAGAANSIWHSIRTDSLRANAVGSEELPDSVGPTLFNHPDVLGDAFATLQLDLDDASGGYRQLWFVDRIMTHGTLWLGRYVTAPAHRRPARNRPPRAADSTILSRQMALQMQTTLMAMASQSRDDDCRLSTDTTVNASSLAYFAHLVSSDVWSVEADEKRGRELVAVFDVDGPCTVATPFVPDWEVLPRPVIRGMSVCWVVESAGAANQGNDKGKGKELLVDHAQVGGDGLGDAGESANGDSGGEVKEGHTERYKALYTDEGGKHTLYRVMNKVKGLWEIIEMLPQQQYVFV
jgi:hypothetical protein